MDIQVEYLPLSKIVGADINPKDHDIGQIYQSIKHQFLLEIFLLSRQMLVRTCLFKSTLNSIFLYKHFKQYLFV